MFLFINIQIFIMTIVEIIMNMAIKEIVASDEGIVGNGLVEGHAVRCKLLSKVWFLCLHAYSR